MSKHSQSALEYMMTYGWAILIIVIVAGVLYSLGIFNPTASAGTTVTGFANFNVQASCIQDSVLLVSITNGLGYTVNLTRINATSSSGQSVSIPASMAIKPNQALSVYIPSVCPTSSNSQYAIQVKLTYTEPGQIFIGPYVSTGQVSGDSLTLNQSGTSFSFGTVASFSGSSTWVQNFKPDSWTNGYTMSAWVYDSSTPCVYVVGLSNSSAIPRFGLTLTCTGNFKPYSETINSSSAIIDAGTANILTQNAWYFLAAVFNPTSHMLQFYINGLLNVSVSDMQTAASLTPLGNSWCLRIVSAGCSNTNSFTGKLGNIEVYNTVLSGSQILQLYKEGIGGAPIQSSGLSGWWPLNDNFNDYSGNGNNAAAVTGVQWVSP